MSRMRDVGKSPIVKLLVEEYRQEEDVSFLAVTLAEQLHEAGLAQRDYETLSASARAERQKAANLNVVIFQLKERQRSGFVSESRMDPLSTYDLGECEKELGIFKERANELQESAMNRLTDAEKARRESDRLQRKIRKLNSSKRSK